MVKKKICFIASAPAGIVAFHKTNFEKLSEWFDIYVVANFDDPKLFEGLKIKGCQAIDIERRPSPVKDLKAIKTLYKYFKEMNFDGFVSMASKPSLVAAIAGKRARIPFRTRIFTGQIWANLTGFKRRFFKGIDRLTVKLNTNILVDGKPQQAYLVENGILKEGQSTVLANGSICGVDIHKFKANAEIKNAERKKLGILTDDLVFGFMGRLRKEKGIFELLEASNYLVKDHKNIKLLLIGNFDGLDESVLSNYANLKVGQNLILYGFTKKPYEALQAADVFCLPSYREGFGMSAIEAASLELPVICSDAYGLKDSYIPNETGLTCKVKDWESLSKAMKFYIENLDQITEHGENGRKRVEDKFTMEMVSGAWLDYLRKYVQ